MGRVGRERGEGRKEQETEGEKEKALMYLILFTWVQKKKMPIFGIRLIFFPSCTF